MRATVYEGLSLTMLLGSVFFLYQCVEFLAQKDYVAGTITLAVGFLVVRTGVDLGKLAYVARREAQEQDRED